MSDAVLVRGTTFKRTYRWGSSPYIYKGISAITKAAPAVLTVTGHGLPDGWPVAIVGALGMVEINAESNPPASTDYHKMTKIDANTISINDINAIPYGTYTADSATLVALTPVSLSGAKASYVVRDAAGSVVIELRKDDGIVINETDYTITVSIAATRTRSLDPFDGTFRFEVTNADGEVTRLDTGRFSVKADP